MAKRKRARESVRFTLLMLTLVAAVGIAAKSRSVRIGKISYLEHRNDTAVTVDGTEYKFRDLAFYLAYQEMAIQNQAQVYDLEQTDKYWNAHANGSFLRLEAKDQAMAMAVHDVIFYQMAMENGTELTQQEIEYMENQKTDFWSDLEEEGRERIGVSEEEIGRTFSQMAYAQKQQKLLSEEEGFDYREYNVNGSEYEALLQKHTYQVNEKLWKRLNFGKIIYD